MLKIARLMRHLHDLTLLIANIKLALQRIGSRCNILYALLYATINLCLYHL